MSLIIFSTYFNILVAIVVLVISYLFYKIYNFYTYWSRHGVKGPNAFDSIYRLFTKQWNVSDYELSRKYGNIFGYYELMNKCIIVNDPDIIRDIMIKDFDTFPNHRYSHFGGLMNLNLFSLPGGSDWKRVRSIITPSFTSGKLKAMTDSIAEIADKFCENISNETKSGAFDIRRYCGAFAMDVITCCAYGIKTNTINEPNHPILYHAKNALSQETTFSVLMGFLAPKIAKFFNMSAINIKTIEYFGDLTDKIVGERKKESTSAKRNDFIQLMINSSKGYHESDNNNVEENCNTESNIRQNSLLTQNEMTAQGIVFFIAGYDTTSNTLSHCFYYLSHYPDVQQKLFEEISELNEEITNESLLPLKYLNAVISETLRIEPTVHRVEREAVKDYKLGNTGITIEKGTTVSFSAYTIQRDPKYFRNPEQFMPERFLTDTWHPYAYFPFGGGQRSCVGTRFAMNEMRMCLAKAIKLFRFHSAQQELNYITGKLILCAKKVLVTVERR